MNRSRRELASSTLRAEGQKLAAAVAPEAPALRDGRQLVHLTAPLLAAEGYGLVWVLPDQNLHREKGYVLIFRRRVQKRRSTFARGRGFRRALLSS